MGRGNLGSGQFDLTKHLVPWNPQALSIELSNATERVLDKLLIDDRAALESLTLPILRAYQYFVGLNHRNTELTCEFAQGRLAGLLELLHFSMQQGAPENWKSLGDHDYEILHLLQGGSVSAKELAKRIGRSPEAIANDLDRLIREELIVPEIIAHGISYRLHDAARKFLQKRAHSSH